MADLVHFQVTVPSFIVKQCRKFKLFPNEKTTVLSACDEFQVVQFCLANHKYKDGGEFEADLTAASQLIENHNKSRTANLENILKDFKGREETRESSADSLPICNEEEQDNFAKDDLGDDSVTSENSSVISDLYEKYKSTSNHCSILDAYSRFLTTALDQESDLHKDLTINEEVSKLICGGDNCKYYQALQIHIIDFLRNISKLDVSSTSLRPQVSLLNNTLSDMDPSGQGTSTVTEPCDTDISHLTPKTPKAKDARVGVSADRKGSSGYLATNSPKTPFSQSQKRELQSAFVKDIFVCYLHLLVNARSQLALARVFNIPDRGLDHKSFTHLKHEASTCGLSMYQTLSSFMLRIQLGGKGYAPSANSPLLEYVKGLGSLLDLIQKLQTVIEEVPDIRASSRRVVNIIKTNVIGCKSGKFPRSLVEPVSEKIYQTLASIIQDMERKAKNSPLRSVGSGGSILGRQCLSVISHFLDATALTVTNADYQLTSDVRFSTQTPTRFPCLLTQFRSPAIMDESEDENYEDAAEKINRTDVVGVTKSKKQFVSSALHIEPQDTVDLILTQGTLSKIEVLPSKTIVHPRADSGTQLGLDKTEATVRLTKTSLSTKTDHSTRGKVSKKKGSKRCAITSLDKENLITSPVPVPSKSKKTESKIGDGVGNSPKSSQPAGNENNKKCRPKSKSTNKSCRRSLMPQVKGQAKITGFFRM